MAMLAPVCEPAAVCPPVATNRSGYRRPFPEPTGAALLLIVSLYPACTRNSAPWAVTGLVDARGLGLPKMLILLTLFLILVAGTFTLAALVCIGPLYRINAALLIVVAVAAVHFMSRYGVVLDTQMIVNVAGTNLGEAGERLTTDPLMHLLMFAGVPTLVPWGSPVTRHLSDHGESLGEGGLYLHGLPYALAPDGQKHAPMLAWFGASFADALRIGRDCAERQAERPPSHGTDADQSPGDVLGVCRSRT